MGKSTLKKLEKVSGQSPIEAANFGCKIYNGPYVYNFKEIYDVFAEKYSKKNRVPWNAHKKSSRKILKKIIHNQQFISFVQSLGEKTMVNTMEQIDNFLNYEKV